MTSFRQFFKFAAVGTLGFIVDASVLYAMAGWLGWYGARILSFVCAATTTWAFNRFWTFQPDTDQRPISENTHPSHSIIHEYLKYLISMMGGAAINYGSYIAVIHYNLPGRTGSPNTPLMGVAAGSIAGMFVNFLVARYWIFKKSKEKPA